ncbi:MAG: hypothetical protein OXP09_19450 [Gammaproteobacteria bacterium]|nr:hypothetical protein [Gammaproteobacteria bacterium]MDE0367738.1 hypothetical protein [Gammaproteobacteria bacterium]
MSAIIKEVYDAFRSAGVSDEQATAAAQAIPSNGELADKGDIKAVHSELKSDITALHTEVKNDITALRAELKNDITALRAELKNDISTLRAEVKSDIKALRAETRGDMKDLELRMTIKFFAAVGLAVAGIKALDFLLG